MHRNRGRRDGSHRNEANPSTLVSKASIAARKNEANLAIQLDRPIENTNIVGR